MLRQLSAFSLFFCLLQNVNVIADTFYTRSGYVLESNCTGQDREAALKCIKYGDITRVETYRYPNRICDNIKRCLDCFARLNNTKCFTPDIFAEHRDILPTDPRWTDLLININMCGNGSERDLDGIGCLFWKQLSYTQQCGIMELDDCQKRLDSIQCRVKYVQSKCNTATAMKLCENYIIEGDHCVDTVNKCRNMTFEKNKGLLSRGYREYISDYFGIFDYQLDYQDGYYNYINNDGDYYHYNYEHYNSYNDYNDYNYPDYNNYDYDSGSNKRGDFIFCMSLFISMLT
ncbi:hypothetical protein FO519_009357 [Halicephalobus sp. NKZ332]|nr:hypothetical protein FO519_009357 [Halicephalobus sp. NKZ332]